MIQEPEDERPAPRRRHRGRDDTADAVPTVPTMPTMPAAPTDGRGPARVPIDAPATDAAVLPWGDPFAAYAAQLDAPPDATAGLAVVRAALDGAATVPGGGMPGGSSRASSVSEPQRPSSSGRGAALVLAVLRPWLDPRPGELRGLILLLASALTLSLALWFDATRRPSPHHDLTAGVVSSGAAVEGVDAALAPQARGGAPSDSGVGTRADGADGWGLAGDVEQARTADGPVVHVSGAVLVPGVVELERGARVADAIAAAGGAAPDAQLDRLNLARVVDDGEQVHVTRLGEDAPSPQATPSPGVLLDGRIDLNAASATELETLPGIGPARAQAIIAEREARPFRVPGDLRRVPGIGEATFQRLAPLVAVR
jgi:competence protein ComEA